MAPAELVTVITLTVEAWLAVEVSWPSTISPGAVKLISCAAWIEAFAAMVIDPPTAVDPVRHGPEQTVTAPCDEPAAPPNVMPASLISANPLTAAKLPPSGDTGFCGASVGL